MGMTTKEILQGIHDWTSERVAYNISAAHNNTRYADLADALGANGKNVPEGIRKGGMSVKFIQGTAESSDNGYVVYRLKATQFSTNVVDWVCETIPSVQVQTGETVSVAPNILNLWKAPVQALTIALLPGIAGCVNEYMIQFTCPQNAATNLTLPNTIRWINGDEFEPEAGYTYQISIIDNLAVYAGWEAAYNE